MSLFIRTLALVATLSLVPTFAWAGGEEAEAITSEAGRVLAQAAKDTDGDGTPDSADQCPEAEKIPADLLEVGVIDEATGCWVDGKTCALFKGQIGQSAADCPPLTEPWSAEDLPDIRGAARPIEGGSLSAPWPTADGGLTCPTTKPYLHIGGEIIDTRGSRRTLSVTSQFAAQARPGCSESILEAKATKSEMRRVGKKAGDALAKAEKVDKEGGEYSKETRRQLREMDEKGSKYGRRTRGRVIKLEDADKKFRLELDEDVYPSITANSESALWNGRHRGFVRILTDGRSDMLPWVKIDGYMLDVRPAAGLALEAGYMRWVPESAFMLQLGVNLGFFGSQGVVGGQRVGFHGGLFTRMYGMVQCPKLGMNIGFGGGLKAEFSVYAIANIDDAFMGPVSKSTGARVIPSFSMLFDWDGAPIQFSFEIGPALGSTWLPDGDPVFTHGFRGSAGMTFRL